MSNHLITTIKQKLSQMEMNDIETRLTICHLVYDVMQLRFIIFTHYMMKTK